MFLLFKLELFLDDINLIAWGKF